jgi:hypothetical protein
MDAGYDGCMGAVFVPIILIVIVLVLGAIAVKRFTRAEVEHSDRLQNADRPTLRYEVPPGQDPAVVLSELRNAGYDASADSEPGPSTPIVIIGADGGDPPDRERLRAVLERMDRVNVDPEADVALDRPPVRFMDE